MILTLASLLPVYNLLRVEKVIVYVVGGAFVIEADYLSFFLMVAVTALSFFVSIFAIRYMERDIGVDKYNVLFLSMVAGMNGVAIAGDLFNLYVFYELMCISSYVLVAFRREQWEPIEAGFKYLIMSAVGSTMVLLAIALIFGFTGTLTLALAGKKMSEITLRIPVTIKTLLLSLILVGFGVKAALAPLHTWLPDAHPAAPSTISAMLSGIVIETGAYAMIRVLFSVFGLIKEVGLAIAVMATVTMFVGNLFALVQTDIKRLLAFSSIAHMGYMMLGIGLGGIYGYLGGFFHLLNHAFMKGLAFLCAGAFIHAIGSRYLGDLTGIARKMPVTCLCFAIALLSLTGVPPLNGFMSKWLIFEAGVHENALIFTVLAMVNSVIALVYYTRVLFTIYFGETSEKAKEAHEAPISMLIPMALMSLACIVLGVFPQVGLSIVKPAVESVVNRELFIKAVGLALKA